MTAPAGWQKGTWRGVAFVTEGHAESGGRRGVLHEFPQAEKPVWEDLGKSGGRFTLDCHIRGSAYPAGADALRVALAAAGVGTLIHPWYGSMQVAVESWSRRDTTVEGGFASFTIDFVESGLPAVPAPTADTAAKSKAAAADAATRAKAQAAKKITVAKATAFVERAAEQVVAAMAIATQVQAGLLGGTGAALRALDGVLGTLGAVGIVRDAVGLAQSVVGAVQLLSLLGGTATGVIGALSSLLDFGSDLSPVIGDTPARATERANQAALVQLVNAAAASELVRVVAGIDFASYQDAIAVRDAAAAAFDRLALRQADAGDDDGAALYDDLRAALVRDVTARGGTLARLQDYVPTTTEPALVIAMRLYGDPASVAARADEIVARNRIAHPGFVRGGVAIQVLTPPFSGQVASYG